MEYEEKFAISICEKYNLDRNTIKVWKSRGKIPDRYKKIDYYVKKKTTIKNIEHLKKIFSSKHLNKSKFKISSNLRQSDIRKGKSVVTTKEYREVIDELKSILKIFNQHKEHKSALGKTIVLEEFLSNKLIHKYTFLEKNSYNNYNIEKIMSKRDSCPSIFFIRLLIKKIDKFFEEIEI